MSAVTLVCSNRKRPYLPSANNHKRIKTGDAIWGRDAHHATIATDAPLYHGAKTLCGVDATDWLVIERFVSPAEALAGADLCKRCAAKLCAAFASAGGDAA